MAAETLLCCMPVLSLMAHLTCITLGFPQQAGIIITIVIIVITYKIIVC
jgi:hypothetical protein